MDDDPKRNSTKDRLINILIEFLIALLFFILDKLTD